MTWLSEKFPVTPLALGLEITFGVLLLLSLFFLFSLHRYLLSYLRSLRLPSNLLEDIRLAEIPR